MKYWAYFVAKLAAAGLIIAGGLAVIHLSFPQRVTIFHTQQKLFMHDLSYTMVIMLYFLFCAGLLNAVIWDQRYRCRTCLRRLRMPVASGSWPNMLLTGQPRMEYICIYGHGTLKVPEVDITGSKRPDWQSHDDIWTELDSLEAGKK